MLLRRITKHVTGQNWIAVGLDLLVVIVGILLAMQLSEWNETKKNKRKELSYLTAFHQDFKHNVAEANRLMELHKAYSKRSKHIAVYLIKGEHHPEKELALTSQRVGMRVYPAAKYKRIMFDELVATGNLNLISDKRIRRAIQNFSAHIQQVEKQLQHFRLSVITTLSNRPDITEIYELDDQGNISSVMKLEYHLGDNVQIGLFSASAGTHAIFSRYRRDEKAAAKEVLALLDCALQTKQCLIQD